MGSVCCCFRDECEEYTNPNSSIYRNCVCLRCFLQNFLHMYALFRRQDHHVLPSSIQETSSLTSLSSLALDNSLSDMHRLPPRPLPYDADPRYLQSQGDGLVSRRDKGSSHSHEETEPLRTDVEDASEYVGTGGKWDESINSKELVEYNSRSSLKHSAGKTTEGFGHIYALPEDEDVCPTCLEEYTDENPKIVTKCSHYFHLGCIYEWMERSESCPICGKVMAFEETS